MLHDKKYKKFQKVILLSSGNGFIGLEDKCSWVIYEDKR
jgi:hypothetical protein